MLHALFSLEQALRSLPRKRQRNIAALVLARLQSLAQEAQTTLPLVYADDRQLDLEDVIARIKQEKNAG